MGKLLHFYSSRGVRPVASRCMALVTFSPFWPGKVRFACRSKQGGVTLRVSKSGGFIRVTARRQFCKRGAGIGLCAGDL